MKLAFKSFLVIALAGQLVFSLSPAKAVPDKVMAICAAAEKALQGQNLSSAEQAEARQTIRTQCSLASLLPSDAYSNDSARACNDIKYEVKNRWRLSRASRAVLLGVVAEQCRPGTL
ncbi:MAG: hypothetical protein SFV17_10400 [Candidatus Obscuribacter sp.]|nr:hypothetical protein [Candidatus Obscuribacter sp.]